MLTERECLAALPPKGFLASYVRDYAQFRTDAHVGFHIACGLATLTQVVPPELMMRFGGMRVRANLFTLLVGSSASRKGAAIDLAKEILELNTIKPIEKPASKESLCESLMTQPRALLVFPEFATFLASSKNGPMAALKSMLNELYDCQEVGFATVGAKRAKKNSTVQNPRVSLLAGCAPNYLSKFSDDVDWSDGFFARYYCIDVERERFFKRPTDDPDMRAKCALMLADIKERAINLDKSMNVCHGLDSAAGVIWDKWSQSIEDRCFNARFPAMIIRATTFAQKIALLLSCDYGDGLVAGPWRIRTQELEPAIALAELHIKSATSMAEAVGENLDMRDRHNVLRCVQVEPTPFSQIITGSRLLNWRVKRILESLREEKVIRTLPASVNGEEHFARIIKDQDHNQDRDRIQAQKTSQHAPTSANGHAHTAVVQDRSHSQKTRSRSRWSFGPG